MNHTTTEVLKVIIEEVLKNHPKALLGKCFTEDGVVHIEVKKEAYDAFKVGDSFKKDQIELSIEKKYPEKIEFNYKDTLVFKVANTPRIVTLKEYNSLHKDYKGIWTTEDYNNPNWEKEREMYMGKRSMLFNNGLRTCLLVEGLHFIIK